MSDLHSSRLLILCARPGDDPGGRSGALRLAAAVLETLIKGPVFYGLHLAETLWPGSVPPKA